MRTIILTLVALTLGAVAHGADPGVAPVNARTHWRYYLVRKTEEVRFEDGTVHPIHYVGRRHKAKMEKLPKASRSALPPEAWRGPDFDDSAWPRRRLAVMSTRGRIHSLLCARTQFYVADPARTGDLALSVSYRGGVVLYLNGEELARAHMPKGKIDADTPADDYPKDAYLDPDGYLLRLGWGDTGKYRTRFAARTRAVKGVVVPAAKLRKGVNTLALELHRPPTDVVLHTGKTRQYNRRQWCPWTTLGLVRATLTAKPGAIGLDPPGKGLHVDTVSTLIRLYRDEQGDPCREPRAVRLYGARNGAFSGRIIVSAAGPIQGLNAVPADLATPGGARISAASVEVRYARRDGPALRRGGPGTFEGLAPAPPASIAPAKGSARAAQPVWVTVHVPKDAAPGSYRGTLTLRAEGGDPVEVKLDLSVADWALPDVKDFACWFGLVQSPDTLALHYKVPMWSEKHWALIDRSLELMGQVGTRIIYIPLIRRSHFGNTHSMVRWIRKPQGGADGWSHDFSIVEKYLDLAVKRLGKLDAVCLHCWGRTSGGAYMGRGSKEMPAKPMFISVLDPQTGALTEAEGPTWNSPDIVAFWKPVFDGIRARLAKHGADRAMMVGIAHDTRPSKTCVAALKTASGGAPWVAHTHPRTWGIHGERVGYLAHVWGSPVPTLDPKRRRYGWRESKLYATFPRYGSTTVGKLSDLSPPLMYRVALESAITAGLKGYGWIGADFWPVTKGRYGGPVPLLDRYPGYDRRANLGIHHAFTHILKAGADGPVASARLETVRQGAQETEARVFIERTLLDPAKKAKLGAELAGRCQKRLDGRIRAILNARSYWDTLVWTDWEKQKGDLFALAAEVAGKLK